MNLHDLNPEGLARIMAFARSFIGQNPLVQIRYFVATKEIKYRWNTRRPWERFSDNNVDGWIKIYPNDTPLNTEQLEIIP